MSVLFASAPGAARFWLHFSPRIVRLLTDYRLWANDQPQGDLARLLAGATRTAAGSDHVMYEGVTQAQHDALRDFTYKLHNDIRAIGCNQSDSSAVAQWRRRMREAGARTDSQPAATKPAQAARTVVIQQDLASLFQQPPAQGAERKTYEQRVWATLVDFIDFTQSSAWMGAPA